MPDLNKRLAELLDAAGCYDIKMGHRGDLFYNDSGHTLRGFDALQDPAACLWAWKRVMGDERYEMTSCGYNYIGAAVDAHEAVVNGLIGDEWIYVRANGTTELEARTRCMIAVLERLNEVKP